MLNLMDQVFVSKNTLRVKFDIGSDITETQYNYIDAEITQFFYSPLRARNAFIFVRMGVEIPTYQTHQHKLGASSHS